MKTLRLHALLLALVLCASACRSQTPAETTKATPVDTVPPSDETLTDLAIDLAAKTWGEPANEQEVARLVTLLRTPETRSKALDLLLSDPRFGINVAPDVLVHRLPVINPFFTLTRSHMLKKTADGIYHLRGPCKRKDAVAVEPWWDMSSTVLVCPDSYRPEVIADAEGRFCSGNYLDPTRPDSTCGCGPALAFCFESLDQTRIIAQSLKAEVDDTIARVVNAGNPVSEVFTSRGTVRNRWAEFFYRRWQIVNGAGASAMASLGDWPDEPVYSDRPESYDGQHAGVLTTQRLLYMSSGPRDRMRIAQTMLWCSEAASVRVDASTLLALPLRGDLREGEGGKELAATPVCEDCHARLDYGMDFFSGWPSNYRAVNHIDALAHPGEMGKVFVADSRDFRGSALRTPRNYAEIAVKQPEYRSCLARRVTNLVASGLHDPEDLAAVEEAFDRGGGRLQPMMHAALASFVDRRLRPRSHGQGGESQPGRVARAPADPEAEVVLSSSSRDLMGQWCGDCHFDGATITPNLEAPKLRLDVAVLAVDQVAFGIMPKTAHGLSPSDRQRFVESVLTDLGHGPDSPTWQYFAEARGPLAIHGGVARQRVISGLAGASLTAVEFMSAEDAFSFEQDFASPLTVAIMGIGALRACQQAGKVGDELRVCMAHAASLRVVSTE